MVTTIGQLATREVKGFSGLTLTPAADQVFSNENIHPTTTEWAVSHRFEQKFWPTMRVNNPQFSPTAPKKLAQGCAGCLRRSEIDNIKAILLRTENPETNLEVLQSLIEDLKAMNSKEAAEVLVEFLAMDVPARYAALPAAIEALMLMNVEENLKVKGCKNLLSLPIIDFDILNCSIQALKDMNSKEAAEVLVDFLATNIPARWVALSATMDALMQMGVHENLKVKGLENYLGQNDYFTLHKVMAHLKELEGDKANRLLAKIADPNSPYPEIRQEAQEEVDSRAFKIRNSGASYYKNENFDAAIREYEKALALTPYDYRILFILGALYHKRLECKKALKYFEAIPPDHLLRDRAVKRMGKAKDCIKSEIQKGGQ